MSSDGSNTDEPEQTDSNSESELRSQSGSDPSSSPVDPENDGILYLESPELVQDDASVETTEESATQIGFPWASPASSTVQNDTASELETSYLHPTSLLFTLISQIRQNLIPAAIAAYGAAKGNYVLLALAGLGFVLTLAFAITRYLTLKYRIHDGELTVETGILNRRIRKVPTDQIQNKPKYASKRPAALNPKPLSAFFLSSRFSSFATKSTHRKWYSKPNPSPPIQSIPPSSRRKPKPKHRF